MTAPSRMFTTFLRDPGDPSTDHHYPPGDGASQLIQHYAAQLNRHLPGSAFSGSDASDRTGLAIRC
jgi:hypothetical protein